MQTGYYRHFKDMPYQVIDIALHSETQEEYVVYRALYGERRLFIRPKTMFFEDVTRDGTTKPRFQFISPDIPKELYGE